MNVLGVPGWDGFREDDEVSEYDVQAAMPTDCLWSLFNEERREAKEHVRRHVRQYLSKVKKNKTAWWISKIVSRSVSRNVANARRKFMYGASRQLVGCSVNVSALATSTPESFDINKILHSAKRGPLQVNRKRNAAVQVPIRIVAPTRKLSPQLRALMSRPTMHEILDFSSESLDTIGDRSSRDMSTSKAKRTSKQYPGYATSSPGHAPGSLTDLIRCKGMPRDHKSLTYPSTSNVLTGANDPTMALHCTYVCQWYLAKEGLPCDCLESFSIQNDVSTFRMPIEIDLERLKSRWGSVVSYVPRNFPAAIFRPPDSLVDEAKGFAASIKQLRRTIIEDEAWRPPEELESRRYIAAQVASAKFNRRRQNLLEDVTRIGSRRSVVKDADAIRAANKAARRFIRTDRKLDGSSSIVALIYSTGAIVVTGTSDLDVSMGLFDRLYDDIMLFDMIERTPASEMPKLTMRTPIDENDIRTVMQMDQGTSRALASVVKHTAGGSVVAQIAAEAMIGQIAATAKSTDGAIGRRKNLITLGVDGEEEILRKHAARLIGSSGLAPGAAVEAAHRHMAAIKGPEDAGKDADTFSRMMRDLVDDSAQKPLRIKSERSETPE